MYDVIYPPGAEVSILQENARAADNMRAIYNLIQVYMKLEVVYYKLFRSILACIGGVMGWGTVPVACEE